MTQTDPRTKSRSGRLVWVLVALAILALGAGGYWALTAFAPEEEGRAEPPEGPLVTTARVQAAQAPTLVQTAFVRAAAEVQISPEVTGRIATVSDAFILGGRVAAGTTLITLEQRRFAAIVERAEAGVAQAEAALAQARADLGRQETLEERDVVAATVLEDARVQEIAAEADLALAEADLVQARIELDDTVVRAPFDAIVAEENAAPGQIVQAGAPVGRLVQADHVEALLGLSQRQAVLIGSPDAIVGRRVTVRPVTGAGEAVEGIVASVDPAIDPAARTLDLLVRIDDPFPADAPARLRIDALVEISLPLPDRDGAVTVPPRALKPGDRVWRIDQGRLRGVDVTVLQRGDGQILLDGGALQDGDAVLLTELGAPFDGQVVRIDAE